MAELRAKRRRGSSMGIRDRPILSHHQLVYGELRGLDSMEDGCLLASLKPPAGIGELQVFLPGLLEAMLRPLVGRRIGILRVDNKDYLKEVGPDYEAPGPFLEDMTSDLRRIVGLLPKGRREPGI
jgi:hypothetical protein